MQASHKKVCPTLVLDEQKPHNLTILKTVHYYDNVWTILISSLLLYLLYHAISIKCRDIQFSIF